MFIDTHAHLYAEEFSDDREIAVRNAILKGVKTILLPNIDCDSIEPMHQLMDQFPENCLGMMGLHPGYVKEDWQIQLEKIEAFLFNQSQFNYHAVGEIGMDLFWDSTFIEAQKIVFRTQVQWAKKLKLPIAIHVRKAFAEVYEILDSENNSDLTGVFHCFGGSIQDVKKIEKYKGFKLGIGGVLTFKNAGLVDVLKVTNISNLVLETDSPYLAPVPFRGKRNESSYIPYIAEFLATIYKCSVEEIASITTQNAQELFKLDQTK